MTGTELEPKVLPRPEGCPELAELQADIALRLRKLGYDVTVRLLRDSAGAVGVTVFPLPADGGRRVLEVVYRKLRPLLRPPRGRPAQEPTRQVKCRIPEGVYARLEAEAKRRRVTPSRLLRELAEGQGFEDGEDADDLDELDEIDAFEEE